MCSPLYPPSPCAPHPPAQSSGSHMASSHFPTKCTNTEAMILPRNAHQRPSIWVFFFYWGPGQVCGPKRQAPEKGRRSA